MFLPDFERELALERIEPLVLLAMQMTRGATFLVERILYDEETAISFAG